MSGIKSHTDRRFVLNKDGDALLLLFVVVWKPYNRTVSGSVPFLSLQLFVSFLTSDDITWGCWNSSMFGFGSSTHQAWGDGFECCTSGLLTSSSHVKNSPSGLSFPSRTQHSGLPVRKTVKQRVYLPSWKKLLFSFAGRRETQANGQLTSVGLYKCTCWMN